MHVLFQIKKAVPRRPQSSIYSSDFLMRGKNTPVQTYARIKSGKQERRHFMPTASEYGVYFMKMFNIDVKYSLYESEMQRQDLDCY